MLRNMELRNGSGAVEEEKLERFKDKLETEVPPVSKATDNGLLLLHQVPNHLQFNPFVFTGYRPQMTAWGCVKSLSYLHNETINILSHGLPLLYAIWSLPNLLPWHQIGLPLLPYFHAAATVSPWLGSSIYHLFMNHLSGKNTYECLLQWDVAGVWVTQSCGGFTTVFVGVSCLPWIIRLPILALYIYFASKALYKSVYAEGPWERRSSFAAMFLMRTFMMLLRLSAYGGGHPDALFHVFMQDLWSLIGAVISASLVPERWLPGRFDFAFNSHNIMHVMVVLGGLHMHWAVEKDMWWFSNMQCR